MTAVRITLALVLLPLAIAACTPGPQESLQQALNALCTGDAQGFQETLTADSRRLYRGLTLMTPQPFGCTTEDQAILEPLDTPRQDVRYFRVSDGTRSTRVAVVLEEGAWRIDLFFSEEAEFFLRNADNSPAEGNDNDY